MDKQSEKIRKQLEELLHSNLRKECLKDRVEELKHLPTEEMKYNKKILVVDINYLPCEYKDNSSKEVREFLENEYGYTVFLIDKSRANIMDGINQDKLPVYFIK